MLTTTRTAMIGGAGALDDTARRHDRSGAPRRISSRVAVLEGSNVCIFEEEEEEEEEEDCQRRWTT
jgi:hypothetical protein